MVGFNQYEAHLSFTPVKVFKKLGYKVITVGFGNPRNIVVRLLNRLRIRPPLASMETFVRLFPSLGQAMVAYKDIGP